MAIKVTKKKLEEALETYASLVEAYPDNEAYLQRYADMLQALGREATATITLQHLHDIIAERDDKEAAAFAKKYPQIGRISLEEIFDAEDNHMITGKIIFELLGNIWLKLHSKTLKEGQVVYQTNDLSDSLTLVLSGNIELYAVNDNNMRILLEKVGVHDILGEQTFLYPNKIGFDAYVSSEKASIIRVPRKKLQQMVGANKHLADMLSLRATFRAHIRLIVTHPIFKTLPLKLCKYLARNVTVQTYKKGMFIHTLDNWADGIDIILAGDACYLAKNKTDEKLKLPPLPIGSLTGNLTLTSSPPQQEAQSSELYAHSNVKIAHLSYLHILNVSTAFPPLMERLLQYAGQQQQQTILALSKLKT